MKSFNSLILIILVVTNLAQAQAPVVAHTPADLIDQALDAVRLNDLETLSALSKIPRSKTAAEESKTLSQWVRLLRPVSRNRTPTFPTVLINPQAHAARFDVMINGLDWSHARYIWSALILDTRDTHSSGQRARIALKIECREIYDMVAGLMADQTACWITQLARE